MSTTTDPVKAALHETHVCRDCGAEITLPYAKPDESLEGYWEKAYWRIVPKLAEALATDHARKAVGFMPLWARLLWRANNAAGNRCWHLLPYRLRDRWAREWTTAGSPREP